VGAFSQKTRARHQPITNQTEETIRVPLPFQGLPWCGSCGYSVALCALGSGAGFVGNTVLVMRPYFRGGASFIILPRN